MSQTQSVIDLCNIALGYLGAAPILSLEDGEATEDKGRDPASLCRRHFPVSRDSTLEDGDWRFANEIISVVQLGDAPKPKRGKSYLLPGKVIRVSNADDGSDEWRVPWERYRTEAGEDVVIADAYSPLYLSVIVRVEDTTRWSPLFAQAMAVRLAADISVGITESMNRREQLMQIYDMQVGLARSNDGRQGTSQRTRSDRLRRARR